MNVIKAKHTNADGSPFCTRKVPLGSISLRGL